MLFVRKNIPLLIPKSVTICASSESKYLSFSLSLSFGDKSACVFIRKDEEEGEEEEEFRL